MSFLIVDLLERLPGLNDPLLLNLLPLGLELLLELLGLSLKSLLVGLLLVFDFLLHLLKFDLEVEDLFAMFHLLFLSDFISKVDELLLLLLDPLLFFLEQLLLRNGLGFDQLLLLLQLLDLLLLRIELSLELLLVLFLQLLLLRFELLLLLLDNLLLLLLFEQLGLFEGLFEAFLRHLLVLFQIVLFVRNALQVGDVTRDPFSQESLFNQLVNVSVVLVMDLRQVRRQPLLHLVLERVLKQEELVLSE
uniref:Uncharacterized protein n=1 Tax=Strombidium inclinatum TaxID=197538 RepID=A0A7S3N003_9SPIT|mmetsp:Transcript_33536/g.51547  ORF Transcript_33536/g.51547 Transcript_33536/m.51547 type:complete len:248 (+) Transcript_33536:2056-2799(+)